MEEMMNNCITTEELSAHLDGDLDENRSNEVEQHIKNCVQCYRVSRDLVDMKEDLKTLAHARPGINLWRKIDDALEEELEEKKKKTNRLVWLLPIPVAAAAVLTVVLFRQGDVSSVRPPVQPTPQAKTQELVEAVETVERAELAYVDAIMSLEKVYKSEKSSLDPETLAVVEKSLGEIDTAIERCRKALASDPSSMEANRAMLAAYRQKMDFLFELVGPQMPTSRSVR